MERELARFANRADKQQQGNDGQETCSTMYNIYRHQLLQLHKVQGAKGQLQKQNAQKQAKVTYTGSHKGFFGRLSRRNLVIVEANQKVGAQAHQLPEEIHLQEVYSQNQAQHRAGKKGKEGKETAIARISLHITTGINLHQQGYSSNHHQHHSRKWINENTHGDVDTANMEPGKLLDKWRINCNIASHYSQGYPYRQQKADSAHAYSNSSRQLAIGTGYHADNHKGDCRQQGNQPSVFKGKFIKHSSSSYPFIRFSSSTLMVFLSR